MKPEFERYFYDYRVILATGFSIVGIILIATTPLFPQNVATGEIETTEITQTREVEFNYSRSVIDIEDGLSMMITNTEDRSGTFGVYFETCTSSDEMTLNAGSKVIEPGESGIYSISSSKNLQRNCTEANVDPAVKMVEYTEEVKKNPSGNTENSRLTLIEVLTG